MKFPYLKIWLSNLGRFTKPRWIHFGNGVLNYLNVGRWFQDRNLAIPLRCGDRFRLADAVAQRVKEPASYLEFGVFKGATLRHWAGLLKHPETNFYGFDSFEGLPENWRVVTKDEFKVDHLPQIPDARVSLVKGWFSETLPGFVQGFVPRPSLVLHLDADLYSSTVVVLRAMRPYMKPGTILIFDEFFDREHELKAFDEFLAETGLKVECIGATQSLTQAAFRITG